MFTQASRLSSRISLSAEMRKSGDPFEVEPLPRTFYYPSQQKVLPEDQRKICLSPTQRKQDHSTESPADEQFLQQTNHMKIHEIPTRENGTTDPDQSSSSKFDESWPSTERAMVSTPEADTETSGMTKTLSSEGSDVHLRPLPDSTLARFIHRFRNAPPSSRQARDRSYFDSGKEGEFWWLSSPTPPSSSTPKEGTPPDRLLGPSPRPSLSPKLKRNAGRRGASPASPISKTRSILSPSKSSLEGLDPKTADLQQRARTLLEKSDSTLESSSSEAHKPKRITKQGPPKDWIPREAPYVLTPHGPLMERQHRQLQPRPAPPPEEDILYQWRLARKMERAQEQVAKWGPARSTLPLGSSRPTALPCASSLLTTTPAPLVPSQKDATYERPALHVPTPLLVPGMPAGVSSSPAKTQTTFSAPNAVASEREIPSQMIPSHSQVTSQTPTSSHQHSQIATEQSSEAHQIMPNTGQATSLATETPVVSWQIHEPVLVGQDRFETADVPSHMHLSCDILPCPHQRTLIERRGTDKLPLSSPVVESMPGKVHKEERNTDRGGKAHRSVMRDSHEARDTPKTRQKEFEEGKSKAGPHVLKGMAVALPDDTAREKPKIKEAGKHKLKTKREVPQGPGTTDMLSGVIGQVISERLFSTPRSSSSSSLTGSEEGVELREPELQHRGHASGQEDADISSDSEFPDDEVLKMLHQCARRYREQLRQIDSKLNQQAPKQM